MRMLVLGAGLQGTACAHDLLRMSDARVTLADHSAPALPRHLASYRDGRLDVLQLDVRQEQTVLTVMRRHDCVLCALPYYFNTPMTRLAVEAGVHYADLGGNTEIVREQQGFDEVAEERRIAVTPDVGLAPGMVNIVAVEAIRRLDTARTVKLYVGGLPQEPEPPLNYQVVYSLEGALDYYTTRSWVLRDGNPAQVDALSDVERVVFPDPLGTLEAFHTGGGISTMPWRFAGRVDRMEYKTLRYPGHAHIMRAIRDLGLLSLEPLDVRELKVRPRDVFIAAASPHLRRPDSPDLVALKVVAAGSKDGKPRSVAFQLLDFYDEANGISAMMRTTGYSLSITGQMQFDGRLADYGVKPAYETTPFAEYVSELAKRGIRIEEC